MFIVFEGIDGSGKSTQAQMTADWLSSELGRGRVLLTREPGGWDGGNEFRELILAGKFSSSWSEFFLFMADRCEHVARVLEPALDAGKIVICDRYTPSTMAYQLFGGEVSDPAREFVLRLPEAIGLVKPDVVFWLDIDIASAGRRMAERGGANSFDLRNAAYFERVRAGYRVQMDISEGEDICKPKWIRVDASSGRDEIFAEIRSSLECILKF